MAYQHKPGEYTVFKNKNKKTDKDPEYKGSGVELSGQEVWVSSWVNKPDGKEPYLMIKTTPKVQEETKPETKPEVQTDLPF
jgi:hypothetical protein